MLRRLLGSDRPARIKVDIKSFHPEVKASKSVKRFQRYSHLKMQLDVEVSPPAIGAQMRNLQVHTFVKVITYKA